MRVEGRKVNDLYFTIKYLKLDLNHRGRGESRKEGGRKVDDLYFTKDLELDLNHRGRGWGEGKGEE